MTAPRVGDVAAWAAVPDGALAREVGSDKVRLHLHHADGTGEMVAAGGSFARLPPGVRRFPWSLFDMGQTVTIVALHLTGQETADDLRRMAEVFEVREAVMGEPALRRIVWTQAGEDEAVDPICASDDAVSAVLERLHAAGWRPSMTAEDAARMLAGGRD